MDNRPVPQPRFVLRHASPATERFLRNAVETNKNRDLRGRACLYLGELLVNKARIARDPWFDRPAKTPFGTFVATRIHPEVLQYFRQTDHHASAVEAEITLERAINEFGDVRWARRAGWSPQR